MIRPGMSRREIETILGQPAIVRTDVGLDGRKARTAVWTSGPDHINVTFRNGRAGMIVAGAYGSLPVIPLPASETGDDDDGKHRRAPADKESVGKPEIRDLNAMLKGLEQKVGQRNQALEELLKENGGDR